MGRKCRNHNCKSSCIVITPPNDMKFHEKILSRTFEKPHFSVIIISEFTLLHWGQFINKLLNYQSGNSLGYIRNTLIPPPFQQFKKKNCIQATVRKSYFTPANLFVSNWIRPYISVSETFSLLQRNVHPFPAFKEQLLIKCRVPPFPIIT